ncbi:MAG: hypothetical protein KF767_07950 [Bdellovibrionaceae bacterium]|nr:hypothetical protein [Pseudobdellovibrionaceae bacterium]
MRFRDWAVLGLGLCAGMSWRAYQAFDRYLVHGNYEYLSIHKDRLAIAEVSRRYGFPALQENEDFAREFAQSQKRRANMSRQLEDQGVTAVGYDVESGAIRTRLHVDKNGDLARTTIEMSDGHERNIVYAQTVPFVASRKGGHFESFPTWRCPHATGRDISLYLAWIPEDLRGSSKLWGWDRTERSWREIGTTTVASEDRRYRDGLTRRPAEDICL